MTSRMKHSCSARDRTPDPEAAYREDLLRLLARLGLDAVEAVALVEANTGRPFETCSPADLLPLLQELLALVHSRTTPLNAMLACCA
jgi:hypothetical protein